MTMPIETPPSLAEQLGEYVVMRANRGDDVASILAGALQVFGEDLPVPYVPTGCRSCGCTDDRACPGGCSWVEYDLCSMCSDGQAIDALQSIRILRGLFALKRERGGTPLGLA